MSKHKFNKETYQPSGESHRLEFEAGMNHRRHKAYLKSQNALLRQQRDVDNYGEKNER